jgi:hypothetical protein
MELGLGLVYPSVTVLMLELAYLLLVTVMELVLVY